MINVTYRAVDGARDKRTFKTLKGAQKYAQDMVGVFPEMGPDYAVSGDGIGRVRVTGCTLLELFPQDAPRPAVREPYRTPAEVRAEEARLARIVPLEDIFADFIRQEAGLPEGM